MQKSVVSLLGVAALAGTVLSVPSASQTPSRADATTPIPVTPGYYRTPVGKFELFAISDGAYHFTASRFLSDITTQALSKALAEADLRDDYPQAINAFLVRTPSRLILVDAGLGDMPAKVPELLPILGKTGYGRLPGNLRAAGFAPEQVDEVLITHLHVDHIGGLVRDGRAVFPNATVRVARRDVDFWLSDTQRAAHPALAPLFAAARMALAPYQARGRLKPFDGAVELAPGVRSVPTTGHTPGHTSYLFESEGHRLLVWGDILHVPAVQFARPAVTMKFDVDPAVAEKSREAMLSQAVRDDDQVAGAHLFFPGIGRVRRNGAGYEWLPIAYPGQ